MSLVLRKWQVEALEAWKREGFRGIVSVVTGGGKTIFALACIKEIKAQTSLIVVPTKALLDQWWEEASQFFGISLDEINIISSKNAMCTGTINLAVINTASKLAEKQQVLSCFLIVDECHKAASSYFKNSLSIPSFASLGLSATPDRQYDNGLNDVIVPHLGPIIYEYNYLQASRDGVIVPFVLHNIVFDLDENDQSQYNRLTKSIAQSIKNYGFDDSRTISLLLKRARVLNLSLERIRLTLRLVASYKFNKIIIFHEDIKACEILFQTMRQSGVSVCLYHSAMSLRERAESLLSFRKGSSNVLVTCRALDEGFNVPEAEIGIVAASTATQRQRIQRLGRVLRPSVGKENAIIYTLVATEPEIRRLKDEEDKLSDIADVIWSKA